MLSVVWLPAWNRWNREDQLQRLGSAPEAVSEPARDADMCREIWRLEVVVFEPRCPDVVLPQGTLDLHVYKKSHYSIFSPLPEKLNFVI